MPSTSPLPLFRSEANDVVTRRIRIGAGALLVVSVLMLLTGIYGAVHAAASARHAQPPSAAIAPAGESAAEDHASASIEDAAAGRVLLVEPEAWSTTSRRGVDEALGMLPASVLADLGNPALGPLYVLVNEDGRSLSGKQPYGRAANFFSTNDGKSEVVLYPSQSALTVLHELGHAYNLRHVAAGRYPLVLLEPEMQSFLDASGWRVLTPPDELRTARDQRDVQFAHDGPGIWARLSNDDPLEDFANSFALYFGNPKSLASLSPQRFAWFVAHFAVAD